MDDETRIEHILATWQEQLDRGDAAEPEDVIAAHPELAERLRECFTVLLAVRIGDAPAPRLPLRGIATDRYSVFRRVAEGGMGLVYWAIDNDLNREVAFKVIRTPGAQAAESAPATPGEIAPPPPDTPASRAFETLKQRFLQEAWVTGGMAHPGIVPVYELGQTAAGVPYYTMRFVRGDQTLADALAAVAGASRDERLQLLEPFLKVCDTLEYAHAQGVIHRDLKPENIALGHYGEVVVLDWGLAKLQVQPDEAPEPRRERFRAWREVADLKTLSAALGTPGYMAPEAVAGQIDEIDERSDVYSLGAILFRILTGRAVFEGRGFDDLARQVLHEEAPSPSDVDPSVPAALSRLCRAALARVKADRPAGVDALAEGIRQWQARSRLDREIEGWLREATSRLDDADGLKGRARVAALDRVLFACDRILDGRPEHEQALALRQRVTTLRQRALEQRHRAARRRLLVQAAVLLLVVGTVASVLVAGALERRRQEAVSAREDAETNLFRARIRGLVAASAEAERSSPMLALLLARDAVRRSNPPPATALSRLYGALTSSLERARFDDHDAEVHSAVFAPGGDAVLTSSHDGTARIWSLDGDETLVLSHPVPLGDASISSTGRHVLTLSEDGTVATLWLREGRRLARLEGHDGPIVEAAFSPAGDRLLTASEDGTARIWDLDGFEQAVLRGHTAVVNSAVFSPAGDRVLTASGDASVRLWDLTGREVARLPASAAVWDARYTPGGDEILVTCADWTSRLWTSSGEELAAYRGAFPRMASDGARVVTRVGQKQLCCHDREGTLLSTFSPPGGAVSRFELLPGEHRVVVGCYDSSVRIWDPSGVHATALLAGHTGWIEHIAFSPTGDRILTASRDGSVRIWEPQGNAQVALRGHTGRIDAARFSPGGEHVLTAARDGTARLWDRAGRELVSVPCASAAGVRFSPAGDRFLVATPDFAARVFDLDGTELAVLSGHTGPLVSLAFTSDGRGIVTASRDGTVRRWSVEGRPLGVVPADRYRPGLVVPSPTGKTLVVVWIPPRPAQFVTGLGASLLDPEGRVLAELGSKVRVAAYSPDGARIVTGSYDGVVGLWDAAGRAQAEFQGHDQSVLCCAFSPDGKTVVTGSDDLTARIWDLAGREKAVLRGHATPVVHLTIDPQGRYLLTGAYDQTARLWDLSGRHLATLHHDGNLAALDFSPDGRTFLTASFDGAVRLWPVEQAALLETADARITRELTPDERTRFLDLLSK